MLNIIVENFKSTDEKEESKIYLQFYYPEMITDKRLGVTFQASYSLARTSLSFPGSLFLIVYVHSMIFKTAHFFVLHISLSTPLLLVSIQLDSYLRNTFSDTD